MQRVNLQAGNSIAPGFFFVLKYFKTKTADQVSFFFEIGILNKEKIAIDQQDNSSIPDKCS